MSKLIFNIIYIVFSDVENVKVTEEHLDLDHIFILLRVDFMFISIRHYYFFVFYSLFDLLGNIFFSFRFYKFII